jgi:hypothetical protein
MNEDWVVEIRQRCRRAGVPFFFKQWGGVNKKKAGRLLDGRTWDEMPTIPLHPCGSDTLATPSSSSSSATRSAR